MFDYKLIEAYAAVIFEGGFEKAAQKLFITQSAVSQRIKLLEEEFGQIILLRTSPPQPTEFGRKILGLYNQVVQLEDEVRSSYQASDSGRYTSIPIGINADALSTWFFQAVRPFLERSRVVLDLLVDDQEETHRFLKDGKVLGCISTKTSPLQGCSVCYLGNVEYSLFCSRSFQQKWFPNGLEQEAIRQAPMITFNRKDQLNQKILGKIFDRPPVDYSTYYIPNSELFIDFIAHSLAYGAMPEQQSSSALHGGQIVDLSPGHHEVVALYWHCWNLDSVVLKELTVQIVKGFAQVCI